MSRPDRWRRRLVGPRCRWWAGLLLARGILMIEVASEGALVLAFGPHILQSWPAVGSVYLVTTPLLMLYGAVVGGIQMNCEGDM